MFIYVYTCEPACVYFHHIHTSVRQKVFGFLKLELQAVVHFPMGMLGSKPRSSKRTSLALNC